MLSNKTIVFILSKVPYIRQWRWEGDVSHLDKSLMIAAPHTSYLDAIVANMAMSNAGLEYRFLSKRKLFRWPFGWVFRMIGCMPIGGIKGKNSINEVAKEFKRHDKIHIVICPEGTRARTTHWNPGFVYMAQKAEVPIVVLEVDSKYKRIHVIDIIEDTSDVRGIMNRLPILYKDAHPYHPERFALNEVCEKKRINK